MTQFVTTRFKNCPLPQLLLLSLWTKTSKWKQIQNQPWGFSKLESVP